MSFRSIISFARKVIPSYFMTKINSGATLARFVDQWKYSNKISVVIFGAAANPRTRYLLAAMKYSQFARFAYVSLSENSEEVKAVRESVDIKCTQCENILIYGDIEHEDAVDRLSISEAKKLTKEAIDDFIEKNKFLTLPRVSSYSNRSFSFRNIPDFLPSRVR